jgi:two-component system, sensor histidine kinase and response regulator
VVDDNATNRRILAEMLGNWGLRPAVASGGEKALELLREASARGEPYRLVLTDSHMPGMDGFALAERIQESELLRSTLIMMLTSANQPQEVSRCRQLGIAAYLLKPVKQSELCEAILLATGVTAAEETVEPAKERERPATFRRLRVLLAEDSFVNQKLVVTLLEREGHTVHVAGNGRIALAALAAQTFDLVLMDVQMPEMDGLEATAAIRTRERTSDSGHVPIIAMTAHALKGDRERCLEAGMDEYLSKPIHPRQLLEMIWRVMGIAAAAATVEGAASEADVIDWGKLAEAAPGNGKMIAAIVEAALQDAPRLLAAIREAIDSRDASALRLAAHGLKGSLQYFGAPRAVELAAQLESLGQQNDLAEAPALLPQLEAEMARFTDNLIRHQHEHGEEKVGYASA